MKELTQALAKSFKVTSGFFIGGIGFFTFWIKRFSQIKRADKIAYYIALKSWIDAKLDKNCLEEGLDIKFEYTAPHSL